MKNQLWSSIHQFFGDIELLWADFLTKEGKHCGDYPHLLSNITKNIEALKIRLSDLTPPHEEEQVLLPIVIYVDELMKTKLPDHAGNGHPLLQEKLFNSSRGGEVFYDTLDDVLHKGDVPSIVYEVFYFCLNSGFKGRHAGDGSRIESYKNILHSKLSFPDVDAEILEDDDEEEKESDEVPSCKPIFVYYACSFGFIATTYLTFYLLSIV